VLVSEVVGFAGLQITGGTSWADSARDAMKEQCREEAQKNITLPRHLVDEVVNSICVNDCSQHGRCVNGRRFYTVVVSRAFQSREK